MDTKADSISSRTAPPVAPTPAAVKCRICSQQGNAMEFGCWAWHKLCECELNPVALIGWMDGLSETPEVRRIREYVIGVTGMDIKAARAALARDQTW